MNKHLHLKLAAGFLILANTIFAQNTRLSSTQDSLLGFDEQSVIAAAPSRGIIKSEMPVFLAIYQREFIKQKYNLINGTNSINNKAIYKLYPNPNNGNFTIDIAKEINNGEIEVRNILGQIVHKQSVKQGSNSIKTENLSKGIYNYSVLQNKEVISAGKLVVE